MLYKLKYSISGLLMIAYGFYTGYGFLAPFFFLGGIFCMIVTIEAIKADRKRT